MENTADFLNKITQGDCVDLMRKLQNECIDLTVTSPPYDNLRTYNGYSFDFENVAKELYRVTKHGGVVVWVVGDATVKGSETGTSFRQALYFKEIGFNLHDTMIYAKENYVPLTHNRYEQQFEYMFVLSKGKPKTFNPIKIPCKNAGKTHNRSRDVRKYDNDSIRFRDEITTVKDDKQAPNIWFYVIGKKFDKEAHKHPAIFPESLAKDHILSWSNPGDVVLDPFMGSGTTAKMAKLNARNYVGFELSEEYIRIAERRIGIE